MNTQNSSDNGLPPRILMLVPHEPELDPRIKWVTQLCAQVGRTDIIGFCWTTNKPLREYEGKIYIERITPIEYPGERTLPSLESIPVLFNPRLFLSRVYRKIRSFLSRVYSKLWSLLHRLWMLIPRENKLVVFYQKTKKHISSENSGEIKISDNPREISEPLKPLATASQKSVPENINTNCSKIYAESKMKVYSSVQHTINAIQTQDVIAGTLYQRAKSVSIPPKVIICHDIYALEAAIRLKHLFGTPVIYDSHEVWPEADLQASKLQKAYVISLERKLIRQADIVITVNRQIARYLENLYGIKNVLSVPNAEPLITHTDINDRPVNFPIRFLLQGQASPGRGFEELLESWSTLHDTRAVLILRCPENPFFDCLQMRFRDMISNGQVIIAHPVKETELINAASQADVGIIPYGGPTLNHVYACPNKLSQYMQAGLAILHNSDQEFVSDVINRYKCGLSYNSKDTSTLTAGVRYFINNPEGLKDMQHNSVRAAQSEFNWGFQSTSYFNAIKELYQR
jgi:glycosyltransferase involved in cell wall biosynthesis